MNQEAPTLVELGNTLKDQLSNIPDERAKFITADIQRRLTQELKPHSILAIDVVAPRLLVDFSEVLPSEVKATIAEIQAQVGLKVNQAIEDQTPKHKKINDRIKTISALESDPTIEEYVEKLMPYRKHFTVKVESLHSRHSYTIWHVLLWIIYEQTISKTALKAVKEHYTYMGFGNIQSIINNILPTLPGGSKITKTETSGENAKVTFDLSPILQLESPQN